MIDEYDSVVDNISKPQTKKAQLKATEIWTNFCDSKIPVQLNDIIQQFGIKIKGEDLSIDGITRTDEYGLCCIMYSKNISVERQRFTVAHEIGHIVLEHTSILGNCDQFSKDSQEKEANAFAGELLVPSANLKEYVKKETPTVQDIIARYWISKPVAFIVIQNNWHKKLLMSSSFKAFRVLQCLFYLT